jgi:hypothetical protein
MHSNTVGGVAMRDQFTFDSLLPPDLADALELIQQPLPTDPLSATGTLLTGYSGLFKIGTRVAQDHQYSVPANSFWANVGYSGQGKTPIHQRLISDPAAAIRLMHKHRHEEAIERWQKETEGMKKDDKPPKPRPRFPHFGGNYTPEALDIQLDLHEKDGLGALISKDEMSGLLQSLESDTKRGRGTGEAQLLELFDGSGQLSLRVEGQRQYERCHVSLYGNIQPKILRRAIAGDDPTGKHARVLYNLLPRKTLEPRYDDPTDQERAAYASAQKVLERYAVELHQQQPATVELSRDARCLLLDWFMPQQAKAIDPNISDVVRSLLGKTHAHALRWAGILHNVHNLNAATRELRVTAKTMQIAIDIVDTITTEMRLFHQADDDASTLLMRRVHQLSWGDGSSPRTVGWQYAKKEAATTNALRELGSKGFHIAIADLAELGFGSVSQNGTTTYKAERAMPGQT